MVNYLDSRRIAGTTAERSSVPIPATQGGWVELGRATASGGEGDLTVSGLTSKRYYQILYFDAGVAGALARYMQFNGDTGSNYAWRLSVNGGADSTATSQAKWNAISNNDTTPQFFTGFIANYQTKEKLGIFHANGQSTAGAGTAPIRFEYVGKWANTSNAITSVKMENDGTYASGDELIVLGWDPSDTHTTNFWEELANVELTSASDQISSGTITAKKYLWIQYYIKADTASDVTGLLRFNNDSSANYANRYSLNGGADSSRINRTYIDSTSGNNNPVFVNAFIVNNASNEKLVIGHSVWQQTAGATTAPNRWEFVGKWCNTSNQITEIDVEQLDAGDLASGSFLKVWGAD